MNAKKVHFDVSVLLITGFVKEFIGSHYNIPDLVAYLCLQYHGGIQDFFAECGAAMQLIGKDTVKMMKNCANSSAMAYGNVEIKPNSYGTLYIYKWKIKILEIVYDDKCTYAFGIDSKKIKEKFIHPTDHRVTRRGFHKPTHLSLSSNIRSYESLKFEENDELEIIFDTGQKSLKFFKNAKELHAAAIYHIDCDKTYYFAVSIQSTEHGKMQLLNFQKFL